MAWLHRSSTALHLSEEFPRLRRLIIHRLHTSCLYQIRPSTSSGTCRSVKESARVWAYFRSTQVLSEERQFDLAPILVRAERLFARPAGVRSASLPLTPCLIYRPRTNPRDRKGQSLGSRARTLSANKSLPSSCISNSRPQQVPASVKSISPKQRLIHKRTMIVPKQEKITFFLKPVT